MSKKLKALLKSEAFLFSSMPENYPTFDRTNLITMSELPPCPKCKCEYTYQSGETIVCPECFFEWRLEENAETEETAANTKILDSNGNELKEGDTVIIIKDLPVKGSSKAVKAGTKVKNIKLVDGDHNISAKVDGFGAMGLKSEFVRKA